MGWRRATLSVLLAVSALAPNVLGEDPPRRLPFLGEEARKRGYDLPLPFGIGLVYYKLDRAIEVTEVRVGRNGATPEPVSDFLHFASTSDVDNVNVKADVWLLPFLNVYAVAGTVRNESMTSIQVTLPPLVAGDAPRTLHLAVPTELKGSVGGLGITAAGGYKSLFVAADVNAVRADIGFDDDFEAVVASLRGGWAGKAGGRPIRLWVNATYWDTFAVAKGTVADPDGGTLTFEVEQGPEYPWTYGVGLSYAPRPWLELAIDGGSDFHDGWYVALIPVFRF